MVDIIRNQWCEDLEDLLLCPICMTLPRTWIHQCVQGHHICKNCKSQLSLCPTCSQRWSSSRNRLAENLCAKLDEIKLSLIDPEGEINRLLIANTVSVGSQTDETVSGTAAARPPAKKTGDEHTGVYNCRVGGCSVSLLYAPLIKHIQSDHRTQYLELPLGESPVFQHTWPIDYTEQMIFDRAFHVPGMGAFFLKLSSDIFGNLTGFVLMIHSGFVSRQFAYQLEISCCQEHSCASYTGEVCSCRTPATVLREKSLQTTRSDMMRMINHEKQLKCTLLLSKKPQSEDTEQQASADNQQKRYQRNLRGRGGRGGGRGGQGAGAPNPHSNHPMNNRPHPNHPMNNRPYPNHPMDNRPHPNYPMDNRTHRPQTAQNGQTPPLQPLFPLRNRSMNRQPARASSINSLPNLDLRDC